mmetsp:Transcript_2423/g.2370  ORF Transcript_2423/g.2370 Transcript_2423/m.2370 type:complete len:120 (-) Transcript_2423:40-399(-)
MDPQTRHGYIGLLNRHTNSLKFVLAPDKKVLPSLKFKPFGKDFLLVQREKGQLTVLSLKTGSQQEYQQKGKIRFSLNFLTQFAYFFCNGKICMKFISKVFEEDDGMMTFTLGKALLSPN